MTALALGGCGRKGGLDLPPERAAVPARAPTPTPSARRSPACSISTYGSEAAAGGAKGRKKPFVLDPLLD